MMETMGAATETNASMEGVAVQYASCHLLSDEEKMQLWASRPKEGDIVKGKADREKLREAIALLLPKGCFSCMHLDYLNVGGSLY